MSKEREIAIIIEGVQLFGYTIDNFYVSWWSRNIPIWN